LNDELAQERRMTKQDLEAEIKDALKKGRIIIYGAHLVAVELYRYLTTVEINFEFAGFVVTAAEGNPKELEGEKVRELQDCCVAKDTTVMIAMPGKYHMEVERYAREFGFSSFIRVSLEDMSQLKGRQILREYGKYKNLDFELYEDAYDTSWLNMAHCSDIHSQDDLKGDLARQHYKFPTLYHLDMERIFQEAARLSFYKDFEKIFGTYHNIHRLPANENAEAYSDDQKALMHIYMVFSQWDSASVTETEYPEWIRPIQAGSILSEKKTGPYLDEIGDNISDKNPVLAEMTAAYWVWKNAEPVKYKGLCHYRRHFVLSKEEIVNLERNGVDVILTTPRYAPGGIGRMFLAETPVKEQVYQRMMKAVEECHPEDKACFGQYMGECLYIPNNMVIARRKFYDDYCMWVFPVLFKMYLADEKCGYMHMNDRHIAYAAELLTSYYFVKNNKKFQIAVTDYEFCE